MSIESMSLNKEGMALLDDIKKFIGQFQELYERCVLYKRNYLLCLGTGKTIIRGSIRVGI